MVTDLSNAINITRNNEVDDKHLQQLSFNRTHFQRADFNVERFVNLARKRATLEQLHSDLRTYLRHLQNCMITLINDDYADFVNLSSGLAALRESVEKVGVDIKTNWSHFDISIADLEKCANSVEQFLVDLSQSRHNQAAARDILAALEAIQRLYSFLINQPEHSSTSWYSKLLLLVSSAEFWYARVPSDFRDVSERIGQARAKCNQMIRDSLVEAICDELKDSINNEKRTIKKSKLALLFAPLHLLKEQEMAIWRVVSTVIGPQVEQHFAEDGKGRKSKDVQFETMLDQLYKLRLCWTNHAKQSHQFTLELSTFLDACLLNFIISYLDEHFSTVLVPTDVRLFHRCFQLINTKLLQTWPTRTSNPQCAMLLRSIRDKFNLVVYFKLASQPLLHQSKEQSVPEAFSFKIPSEEDTGGICLSPYSNSLLTTLEAMFSPQIFLPILANKFWEFTLQRMDDYLQWAQKVLEYLTSKSNAPQVLDNPNPKMTNSSSASNLASQNGRKSTSPIPRDPSPTPPSSLLPKSPPVWLSLAALWRDLQIFDSQFFQFCLSTIWVHLRQLRVDPTPFGQCLSHFSEQICAKREDIQQALIGFIAAELAKNLAAVSDIPRQYRWTKRPQPVGFSPYLGTAFAICEEFAADCGKKLGWDQSNIGQVLSKAVNQAVVEFCERAEKVLDAVEQTGSSLLRFKQRKATESAGQQQNAADTTDEAKIRAQLCFDANLVRQRAHEYYVLEENIERLQRIEQRATSTNVPNANTPEN